MRSQTVQVLVAGLVAAVHLWNVAEGANQVPWAPDLQSAQRLAAQRGQLVLLHFWSPDCEPCSRLEHTVFNDISVGRAIASGYVPVKVNVKQFPALASQYGVQSWPTDVITTPDGRVVRDPIVTPQDSRQYTSLLGQIAASERVYGVDRVDATRPASPAEGGVATYNRSDGYDGRFTQVGYDSEPRYDSHRQLRGGYDFSAQPRPDDRYFGGSRDSSYRDLPPRQRAEPSQPPTSAEVYNQYASRRSELPPAHQRNYAGSPTRGRMMTTRQPSQDDPRTSASFPTRTDYATRQLEPTRGHGPEAEDSSSLMPRHGRPSYRSAAEPGPRAQTARDLPGRQSLGPQPSWVADSQRRPHAAARPRDDGFDSSIRGPGQPAAEPYPTQPIERRQQAPASPASADPGWGLEGYCPVTLVEQSKWKKGDPRWGVVHRGRTYLFASVDAKQRFWSNPDRFTPALSGIDPVLFTESGQRVEGKRNHGVVFLDRVYLFANEQSLQRFWKSPKGYAEQVRQATRAADEQDRWR